MAKCQLFSFVDDLIEVVPNGLYMRSLVGETLSVGVVKFMLPGAAELPSKHHSHGEEASFQIAGGCTVVQGETGAPAALSHELDAGRVMIIPADEPHYGINKFDSEGVSVRLNVATPPRQDYGTKDKPQVFYHPIQER